MLNTRFITFVALFAIAWFASACSSSEFEGVGRRGSSLKGKDASDGDDSGDGEGSSGKKGKGGKDTDAGDDDMNGGSESDDDYADSDDEDGINGKDEGDDACRFFADEDLAEMINGGPGLAINPHDFEDQWSREGDDIHFPLVAYKVPGDQEVQMHAADIADVLHQAGASDMATLPNMHFKLPSNHWQLEPITVYQLHGINVPNVPGIAAPRYNVKYSYSVVLSNVKSKKCTMTASLTETPFLDRTGGGCFALSTKIRMADGTDKMVALLNVGELVLNPATGKAARITQITAGPEKDKGMIELGFGKSTIKITEGHPVPTTRGLLQAKDLTKADRIQTANGSFERITVLRRLPADATQQVRNLVINPESADAQDHMLLADGIVTGDLYLQQRLARDSEATPGILSQIAGFFANVLTF